jgi:hypothetical protein
MSKPINTPFKDSAYKPSNGGSDFTFEGGPSFASEDFKINGQKVVTIVGDGYLDECLKQLEK